MAQTEKPIGYWESFLPYNSAVGIATDGTKLYTICNQAFFTYNPAGGSPEPYSKVEGMSDIGMQCVGYDVATSTAVLVYTNGNIDLFKDKENTFYNVADLKVKNVAGTKTVFHVYTENGIAYLSTALGILVLDLSDHTFLETYQFTDPTVNNLTIPVYCMTGTGDYFYAATANGLYRVVKNNPAIQNYQVWQKIDSTHAITTIANIKNTLFFSNQQNVFTLVNDVLQPVYSTVGDTLVRHIDAGNNSLFISEYFTKSGIGDVKIMDLNNNLIDSFPFFGKPVQVVQLGDNSTWIADSTGGLEKRTGTSGHDQTSYYLPAGPVDPNSFDIYANNKNLWIAHGGYDQLYGVHYNPNGFTNFNNGKWVSYRQYVYNPINGMDDFIALVKDESTGTLYAGSFYNGLFIMNKDGSTEVVGQNSIFDSSVSYFPNHYQIAGIALDAADNVWVSEASSYHHLYVKAAADGNWYKFIVPGAPNGGSLVIDDNGQAWFACFKGGGMAVYYHNPQYPFSNTDKDASYHLGTGVGNGNLPSNAVFCLAKDLNNSIWVGTDNGIGIISNCSSPFTSTTTQPPCDAQLPIVQYDQYAGYLFAGNNVRSIAVDGANRKWVGTDNGVWLLSPNADKIIYRFTTDNSPLPSNIIQKISIDKVTGDVYIGTSMGLVSYRSTSTEGGTANKDVLVFPNPVKSGYSGTIAIKGLATNADVRITDINGELVYRTTALGGEAVWNGVDYKGHRPQSGVYLVFVSSSDGSQTYTGKIVFLQ